MASSQTLSGTGALHLIGALLKSLGGTSRQVWIPEPTWSNHFLVFESLGFECKSFPYYDRQQKKLDFGAYRRALETIQRGSIVILHACAHNPTGCDPSEAEWRKLGQIVKDRELFPLFDAAYLGFNSGNYDTDAFAIRHFANDLRLETAVAASFAKNMGLYGERVGCSVFVLQDSRTARNVESSLERLQRSEVSNPPAFGAKLAARILTNNKLRRMWQEDLMTMCSRIRQMRTDLHDLLIAHEAPGEWSHIVSQSGMFGFLGLSRDVVQRLRTQHHIYMSENSRISIAGLNSQNVEYVAECISSCLKNEGQELEKARL